MNKSFWFYSLHCNCIVDQGMKTNWQYPKLQHWRTNVLRPPYEDWGRKLLWNNYYLPVYRVPYFTRPASSFLNLLNSDTDITQVCIRYDMRFCWHWSKQWKQWTIRLSAHHVQLMSLLSFMPTHFKNAWCHLQALLGTAPCV